MGAAFWIGTFNISSRGHEQARQKACFAAQQVLANAIEDAQMGHPGTFAIQPGPFSQEAESDLLRKSFLKVPVLSRLPSQECSIHICTLESGLSRSLYCAHHGALDVNLSPEDCPAWIPLNQRPWKVFHPGDASCLLLAMVLFLPLGFLYFQQQRRLPGLLLLRGFLFIPGFLGDRALPFFIGVLFSGLTALAVGFLLWEAVGIMVSGKASNDSTL